MTATDPHKEEHQAFIRDLEERLNPDLLGVLRAVYTCSEATGTVVWLVGGPVRDLLLERPVHDLDVVVEGEGIDFARVVADHTGGNVETHGRFGTARLVFGDGMQLDVATARRERYTAPGALPEVENGSMEEDLHRRDFSINAMALRLGPDVRGRLLDPEHGREDLRAGLLRVLHEDSFRDDPTRIFRSERFAARLGFELEARSERLLATALEGGALDTVSGKRIGSEIVLLLEEPHAERAVKRLWERGVWSLLFGTSWKPPIDLGRLIGRAREAVAWYGRMAEGGSSEPLEPWVVLWLVLAACGSFEQVGELTRRFQLGRRAGRAVSELVARRREAMHTLICHRRVADSVLYRTLRGLGPEAITYLVATAVLPRAVRRMERFLGELQAVEPWVGAGHLKALGVREGPEMGRILERLFNAQLDRRLADRDAALREASRLAGRIGEAR